MEIFLRKICPSCYGALVIKPFTGYCTNGEKIYGPEFPCHCAETNIPGFVLTGPIVDITELADTINDIKNKVNDIKQKVDEIKEEM